LIDFRTSLAVFMNSPYLLRSVSWSERRAVANDIGLPEQPVVLIILPPFSG
jgi:hypothetical protein